jgi:hypothetical protein
MIGYVRPQVGYVHSMSDMSSLGADMSGQQKFCAAKKLPRGGGVNRQSNLKLT